MKCWKKFLAEQTLFHNAEGSAEKWPKTLCKYYKEQALNTLRSIPPMGKINLLDD